MSKTLTVTQHGEFKKVNSFLQRCLEFGSLGYLDKYGRQGVEALAAATPKDTGRAASSWRYEIHRENGEVRLEWHNDDIEGGCNVAVLVQYGHATKNGTWVEGVDYINPALRPIFESISRDVLKEVRKR